MLAVLLDPGEEGGAEGDGWSVIFTECGSVSIPNRPSNIENMDGLLEVVVCPG